MTITANPTTVQTATATLLASVKDAIRAVHKRPSTPVMHGLRLETTTPGTLSVAGFNFDVSITKRVAVAGAGTLDACLVPSTALRDALARLDAKQPVTLGVDGDKLVLTQNAKRVQLKLLNVGDYPDLPRIEAPSDLITSGEVLKQVAGGVAPFLGRDDMLPVLRAVQVEYADNTLSAMATDRFRAAVMDVPVLGERADATSGLVPDFATIGAVFGAEESVSVVLNAEINQVRFAWFESGSTTVTTRLAEGTFPKVRHLFPSEPVTTTSFEPVEFLKSLKFVEAGVQRNCGVSVDIGNGKVILSADGDDLEMSDEVPASITGPDQATGFNPAFLADAVKVWGKGHQVTIGTVTGAKPSVFTSDAIPGLRVLLMPRRRV